MRPSLTVDAISNLGLSTRRSTESSATKGFVRSNYGTGLGGGTASSAEIQFFQVISEIEYHRDRSSSVEILIVAINIQFELVAIHNNLLPFVLERQFHVPMARRAHVIP